MRVSFLERFSTLIMLLAVAHTFACPIFQKLARRFRSGSIGENLFHLLGEVEAVFALWGALFLATMALWIGSEGMVAYAENLDFTEAAFVFVIMTMASTRPILHLAQRILHYLAKALPLPPKTSELVCLLIFGPLLGSLITEPAAMTVTALLLRDKYFSGSSESKFKYALLAVLFVNISIGGVLTPFAAPPVIMVARKWNWDLSFTFATFGWKAILAVVLNTTLLAVLFRREIRASQSAPKAQSHAHTPSWLVFSHLLFLFLVVMNSHHLVIFTGLLLVFIAWVSITQEHQSELRLKESLMVGSFLGGLIVLGGLQKWWLMPILSSLSDHELFLGAIGLTAITDNAALTYLGAQAGRLTPGFQYALVSGAIVGGGLTVIANAPNPAGFAILQDRFGPNRINPLKLFAAALLPTAIAMSCFWFLSY